jgi:hypothetical protein
MASFPARAVGNRALLALPDDLPVHLSTTLSAGLGGGDASVTSSLAVALAAVPDPRCRRGRRHALTGVLTIAACACLTGATSYRAISEWAAQQGAAVLDCRGDPSAGAALPGEATLRRCRQTTDAAALDAAVAGWADRQLPGQQARAAGGRRRELVSAGADRRVLAIDGTTLRGSALRGSAPRATPAQVTVARSGGGRSHLVAGYDHASGVPLGQVACPPEAGKGGEVAAARALAAALHDRGLLAESVITVDAGCTARKLAADLRARRALDFAGPGQSEDAAYPAPRPGQGAALGAGARGRPGAPGGPRPNRDPHPPRR